MEARSQLASFAVEIQKQTAAALKRFEEFKENKKKKPSETQHKSVLKTKTTSPTTPMSGVAKSPATTQLKAPGPAPMPSSLQRQAPMGRGTRLQAPPKLQTPRPKDKSELFSLQDDEIHYADEDQSYGHDQEPSEHEHKYQQDPSGYQQESGVSDSLEPDDTERTDPRTTGEDGSQGYDTSVGMGTQQYYESYEGQDQFSQNPSEPEQELEPEPELDGGQYYEGGDTPTPSGGRDLKHPPEYQSGARKPRAVQKPPKPKKDPNRKKFTIHDDLIEGTLTRSVNRNGAVSYRGEYLDSHGKKRNGFLSPEGTSQEEIEFQLAKTEEFRSGESEQKTKSRARFSQQQQPPPLASPLSPSYSGRGASMPGKIAPRSATGSSSFGRGHSGRPASFAPTQPQTQQRGKTTQTASGRPPFNNMSGISGSSGRGAPAIAPKSQPVGKSPWEV